MQAQTESLQNNAIVFSYAECHMKCYPQRPPLTPNPLAYKQGLQSPSLGTANSTGCV